MLISFIIPVYNVEKYLNECVDSILSQDFKDYEIILVDDGSTDSSGRICDEYAKNHSNISTIHKENGGASDSRNVGLKKASGQYILFIDSDDYIESGSIKKIAEYVGRFSYPIDIMFLEASKVFPDGTVRSLGDGYQSSLINGQSKDTVMNSLASLPKYPGSPCTKLIRREFIVENDLYFTKGIIAEDIDWTIDLIIRANSFAYCNTPYYYYRQNRAGSVTNTAGSKGIECILFIINKWATKDNKRKYQNVINAFLAYEYMISLLYYGKCGKETQKKFISELKKYSWILKYGKTGKIKLVRISKALFGINLTAFLLNIVYR